MRPPPPRGARSACVSGCSAAAVGVESGSAGGAGHGEREDTALRHRSPSGGPTHPAYVIRPARPRRAVARRLHPLADSVRARAAETAVIDINTDAEARRHITFRRVHRNVTALRSRPAGVAVTTAIVGLTLATAYIHLGLGGLLFTLNGLGYVGLAALIVIGAAAPMPIVKRFSWFPRVALAGYTALTIAGYLVMGPYFTLGFIAKGIEVALLAVLAIDVESPPVRRYRTGGLA